MQVKKLKNTEIYPIVMDIQRIGNRAVRKAQERHRKLGIPNVYSRNGIIYYEKNDKKSS
jgi:hypothetical protein